MEKLQASRLNLALVWLLISNVTPCVFWLKLPEPVAKLTPAVLFIATFSSGSLFD